MRAPEFWHARGGPMARLLALLLAPLGTGWIIADYYERAIGTIADRWRIAAGTIANRRHYATEPAANRNRFAAGPNPDQSDAAAVAAAAGSVDRQAGDVGSAIQLRH